jgi:translation initiation factor IF-3
MEVIGKIKVINPAQQVTDSYKKRELVVTTAEQYPQHILIEFTQDKTDLLNNYTPGEQVKVSINLRGREWVNPQGETKYFNSVQGWKINAVGSNEQPVAQVPQSQPQQAAQIQEAPADDLPF